MDKKKQQVLKPQTQTGSLPHLPHEAGTGPSPSRSHSELSAARAGPGSSPGTAHPGH